MDQELQKDIKSEDFQLLLVTNLNPDLADKSYFPRVTSSPDESAIYESIPGDILTYVTETGNAAGRNYYSYKILNNEILPLNLYPQNENFERKISKQLKKGWRFERRADYQIAKQKNGDYIISTRLYLDDDANCCASMMIEYKTKDFKNFTPVRIGKNEQNPEWKIIK